MSTMSEISYPPDAELDVAGRQRAEARQVEEHVDVVQGLRYVAAQRGAGAYVPNAASAGVTSRRLSRVVILCVVWCVS